MGQPDPDIVVYLFCINDISDNGVHESKPYFQVSGPEESESLTVCGYPVSFEQLEEPGFLEKYSFVYRLFDGAIRRFSRGASAAAEDGEPHFQLKPYKRDYTARDSSSLRVTLALIAEMGRYLQSQDKRLLVVEGLYSDVVSSNRQKLVRKTYGDIFEFGRVTGALSAACAANGIAFLSMNQEVLKQGLDAEPLMPPGETVHLNERGVELQVSLIVDTLRGLGWLSTNGDAAENR